METNQALLSKKYYKSLIDDQSSKQPFIELGEQYIEERQKEVFNLTDIRFAQGELYFHYKDYEAAIFKWENIPEHSSLYPWARKNIADAHVQLDFLAIAEDYYKDIQTESIDLQTEILIELFIIYNRRNQLEKAEETIEKAVQLNPDYGEVTKRARAFYEKEENFRKAMELAVAEAIRTKSLSWFKVIKTYVEKGFVFDRNPSYFESCLSILYTIDQKYFEQLVIAMWNYYRQTENYFSWLEMWNELFQSLEKKEQKDWKQLILHLKTTYSELTNGEYFINDLTKVIPKLLINGHDISMGEDKLFFSVILITWVEENFIQLKSTELEKLKDNLQISTTSLLRLEDAIKLYEDLMEWANTKGLDFDPYLNEKVREQLDEKNLNIILVGDLSFYRQELNDALTIDREGKLTHCKFPLNKEAELAFKYSTLIDTQLADLIIYFICQEKDVEKAIELKQEFEVTDFHFIVDENCEEVVSKIQLHFPNQYFQINALNPSNKMIVIKKLVNSVAKGWNMERNRVKKLIDSMREFIVFLQDKRTELEHDLLDHIDKNEEIAEKIYQSIQQLFELQEQKIKIIKNNYQLMIRELKAIINDKIPRILKECSNLVTIDSDFETIHDYLNDEMNHKIKSFINETIDVQFQQAFQEWLLESERQLYDASMSINEISSNFNYMYGEERVSFPLDLQVLNDWKRDAKRMSRGHTGLEKINIIMRSASSKFIMKGAGKLFGSMPNKNILYKKYKQFIETKDYSDIAELIAERVMHYYEFFENSIERDIELFFATIIEELQAALKDVEQILQEDKQMLYVMMNQPEKFTDPIKLFELKIIHLEKLLKIKEEIA